MSYPNSPGVAHLRLIGRRRRRVDPAGGDVTRHVRQSLGDDVPATIVRAVHEQTSGNPFYVREVVKALVEEGKLVRRDGRWLSDFSIARLGIPDTVRDAVRGRLAGLAPATTAFLQAAPPTGFVAGCRRFTSRW